MAGQNALMLLLGCRYQSYKKKRNDWKMQKKAMGLLWRLNNWIDNKTIHIRAWLTAKLDGGEWDTDMDNDIIAKMWKERHG
jgi:hypothetical protein